MKRKKDRYRKIRFSNRVIRLYKETRKAGLPVILGKDR